MNTNIHSHFHTHVNTHTCDCGRTHISSNTHVHTYQTMPVELVKAAPEKVPQARAASPVAQRTRSKHDRAAWQNSLPESNAADPDLAKLLVYLRKSDDVWERSLIPEVEKDAISRHAKRSKRGAF